MVLLLIAWNWQAEKNEWDKVEECCRNNGEAHADFATRKATQMKEHNALVDAHMVNLDELCMMACDGIIHVLGSAAKKKHEKNMVDCRVSTTVFVLARQRVMKVDVYILPRARTWNIKPSKSLELEEGSTTTTQHPTVPLLKRLPTLI